MPLWRSYIARRKTSRLLRIPAGDPSDGEDCSCGDYILTEDGQPILTEESSPLRPES
jgi:hypothetical protein